MTKEWVGILYTLAWLGFFLTVTAYLAGTRRREWRQAALFVGATLFMAGAFLGSPAILMGSAWVLPWAIPPRVLALLRERVY